jgi:hypothetical protein
MFTKACFVIFLSLTGSVRADWIVEQKTGNDDASRTEIGRYAVKETYGKRDRIVDFASATVFRVDHAAKTVAHIDLDSYLRKASADLRADTENPTVPDRVAGMDCMKFSSSYSTLPQAGGSGGAEGCVTKAITVAAPYTSRFEEWLKDTHLFGDHGFLIWLRTQVDGPWRVNLYTTRVRQATLPPTEFRPPAEYKQVEFTWD